MQALKKMMPGAEHELNQQLSSQKLVEAMEREGYLPTAKANLELTDALEKIKVSCSLMAVTDLVQFCHRSGDFCWLVAVRPFACADCCC